MENHGLVLNVCCFVAAIVFLSFWIVVFLLSLRTNTDKQKKNSSGRNNEFFSKKNFEVADRRKQEENDKKPLASDANDVDAVIYFSREDVAQLLETLEEIRKNVDDKNAEDITFDVNINNRHISIVIGGRKEAEK